MLDALVTGTTDPALLAELARGRLRRKLPAWRQALPGRFRAHHAFLVSQLLAHLDYFDEAIDTTTTAGTPSEYAGGPLRRSNAKAIASAGPDDRGIF